MQIYRPELPDDKVGAQKLVEAAINSNSNQVMEPKIIKKSKSYRKSYREKNSHQLIHYLPSTKQILNQMGFNYKGSIRTNSLGDATKRNSSNDQILMRLSNRIDQGRHSQSFSNLPGSFIATRNNQGTGFTDQEAYRSEMRQRIKSAGFIHLGKQ